MSVDHLHVFFEKMSFFFFLVPIFKLGYSVFLVLSCVSSLCILDIHPLSDMSLANIFSHSVGCFLVLLIVSFAVQKL